MNKPYYVEKYITDTLNYLYPKNKNITDYILVTLHIALPLLLLASIILLLFFRNKSVIYLIILFAIVTLYWDIFSRCPYNNLMKKYLNVSLPVLPVKINTVKYVATFLLVLIISIYLIRR